MCECIIKFISSLLKQKEEKDIMISIDEEWKNILTDQN